MADAEFVIIYDNTCSQPTCRTGWGFSVFVNFRGLNLLFDAGADVQVLRHNIDQLNLDMKQLDHLVLSHSHCDHVGGLSAILKDASPTVHLLNSFSEELKERVESYEAPLLVHQRAETLADGVFLTGEMKGSLRGRAVIEQSMALATDRGLVVVSGCAHPGIRQILGRFREMAGEDIYLALGGFHFTGKSRSEITPVVNELANSVNEICPCHCTGELGINICREVFGDRYLSGGVGRKLSV